MKNMEGKQLEEELFYGEVNNNWKHDAVLVRKIMENCSEEVRKVIFDTGCFTDGGRERLFNHIRRGNRGSALGLLLTLLPNLALMRFNRSTGSARQFKKIVQRITKPCGRKSSATHEKGSRVLTKLREVEFRGIDPRPEGWNAYEDFDHARHFTKLPSMRKVSAGFAKSPSQLSKDSWIEVGSRASNIDEIVLKSEDLDATYEGLLWSTGLIMPWIRVAWLQYWELFSSMPRPASSFSISPKTGLHQRTTNPFIHPSSLSRSSRKPNSTVNSTRRPTTKEKMTAAKVSSF